MAEMVWILIGALFLHIFYYALPAHIAMFKAPAGPGVDTGDIIENKGCLLGEVAAAEGAESAGFLWHRGAW